MDTYRVWKHSLVDGCYRYTILDMTKNPTELKEITEEEASQLEQGPIIDYWKSVMILRSDNKDIRNAVSIELTHQVRAKYFSHSNDQSNKINQQPASTTTYTNQNIANSRNLIQNSSKDNLLASSTDKNISTGGKTSQTVSNQPQYSENQSTRNFISEKSTNTATSYQNSSTEIQNYNTSVQTITQQPVNQNLQVSIPQNAINAQQNMQKQSSAPMRQNLTFTTQQQYLQFIRQAQQVKMQPTAPHTAVTQPISMAIAQNQVQIPQNLQMQTNPMQQSYSAYAKPSVYNQSITTQQNYQQFPQNQQVFQQFNQQRQTALSSQLSTAQQHFHNHPPQPQINQNPPTQPTLLQIQRTPSNFGQNQRETQAELVPSEIPTERLIKLHKFYMECAQQESEFFAMLKEELKNPKPVNLAPNSVERSENDEIQYYTFEIPLPDNKKDTVLVNSDVLNKIKANSQK
ncbi:hypothetical protein TVAG_412290 [Trichomonas vaginalis G3]|uniref:Uncharacterized protein n=1 Tax=Trichomonas vaginalis (strain ATCC PRA-98 / G3) TaxID=412133 RepID=A2F1N5_TRIV3|nr:hypothetical protein TVAGG3_0761050 [Trichomonas vaginalis G3]EAY01200.1 hypothetical protein TVAG_412290 [Trichomonas vaginalis G3]KAI5513186.1 hypothetical protein TVAGG3_0761050 [Trichomonas vaginalis G3]|eukprot:XP_001314036.1 hypothetical protein [Trichomonas vaginalis G3]